MKVITSKNALEVLADLFSTDENRIYRSFHGEKLHCIPVEIVRTGGSVRAFLVEQSQKTASTFAKRAVGGEHIAWIIGSLDRSNRQYYGHIDSTGLHLQ